MKSKLTDLLEQTVSTPSMYMQSVPTLLLGLQNASMLEIHQHIRIISQKISASNTPILQKMLCIRLIKDALLNANQLFQMSICAQTLPWLLKCASVSISTPHERIRLALELVDASIQGNNSPTTALGIVELIQETIAWFGQKSNSSCMPNLFQIALKTKPYLLSVPITYFSPENEQTYQNALSNQQTQSNINKMAVFLMTMIKNNSSDIVPYLETGEQTFVKVLITCLGQFLEKPTNFQQGISALEVLTIVPEKQFIEGTKQKLLPQIITSLRNFQEPKLTKLAERCVSLFRQCALVSKTANVSQGPFYLASERFIEICELNIKTQKSVRFDVPPSHVSLLNFVQYTNNKKSFVSNDHQLQAQIIQHFRKLSEYYRKLSLAKPPDYANTNLQASNNRVLDSAEFGGAFGLTAITPNNQSQDKWTVKLWPQNFNASASSLNSSTSNAQIYPITKKEQTNQPNGASRINSGQLKESSISSNLNNTSSRHSSTSNAKDSIVKSSSYQNIRQDNSLRKNVEFITEKNANSNVSEANRKSYRNSDYFSEVSQRSKKTTHQLNQKRVENNITIEQTVKKPRFGFNKEASFLSENSEQNWQSQISLNPAENYMLNVPNGDDSASDFGVYLNKLEGAILNPHEHMARRLQGKIKQIQEELGQREARLEGKNSMLLLLKNQATIGEVLQKKKHLEQALFSMASPGGSKTHQSALIGQDLIQQKTTYVPTGSVNLEPSVRKAILCGKSILLGHELIEAIYQFKKDTIGIYLNFPIGLDYFKAKIASNSLVLEESFDVSYRNIPAAKQIKVKTSVASIFLDRKYQFPAIRMSGQNRSIQFDRQIPIPVAYYNLVEFVRPENIKGIFPWSSEWHKCSSTLRRNPSEYLQLVLKCAELREETKYYVGVKHFHSFISETSLLRVVLRKTDFRIDADNSEYSLLLADNLTSLLSSGGEST